MRVTLEALAVDAAVVKQHVQEVFLGWLPCGMLSQAVLNHVVDHGVLPPEQTLDTLPQTLKVQPRHFREEV